MARKVTRREFVQTSTAGLAVAAARPAFAQAPAVVTGSIKPVVVSSSNGNRYKHGGPVVGVQKAFEMITKGSDVLDAVVAGVNLCELDPEDTSVGYGGLPNAEGVVQLDSCCMHGPTRRAGGVACIEGVRTPSLVAKAVLEQTDHHLLVGRDAREFARGLGFKIEDDLNTERSRQLWLEWKRRIDPEHYLDPKKRGDAAMAAGLAMVRDGLIDPDHFYGTINMDGISPKGEICGVTTTSGLAWKIPGRSGDSPIVGAGQYTDGEVGAAGSTGLGEANIMVCGGFLTVEHMRQGMKPTDACLATLKRVVAMTPPRLLGPGGRPTYQIQFYAVNKAGDYGCAGLYPTRYAACDDSNGARELDGAHLFERR